MARLGRTFPIRARRLKVFIQSAGSGNQTIDVPVATIVVAGAAPTVNRTQSVTIPAAPIVVAGETPSVAQSTAGTITVPVATISVNAHAPTVNRTQSVTVPAANVVVAANVPSIGQGQSVTIPAANIAVTAHAPTVNRIQSILVPEAPIIVNAYAPTVTVTGIVSAQQLAEIYGGNIISKRLADAKKGGRKKKREKEPLEEMVFEVAKTPEGKRELIKALPVAVQDEFPVAQMALVSDLITKIEAASTQVQKKVERIYRQREEDDEDDVFILLL